jgi:anti-anti-sigma regulatory factor
VSTSRRACRVCVGRWAGRQAVGALPEHMDVANAGQIGEELLSVINGGATALIADMTATTSCDHAGAGAVVSAFPRAILSGAEPRLVVTALAVSRVLGLSGLDRLIPSTHPWVRPRPPGARGGICPGGRAPAGVR